MTKRDNFYDCIRALAALFVLFGHHQGWLSGGSVDVSMFFCLSGLLITEILLRLPALSLKNVLRFIFRRFMRVWPMMAFQIFLVLGLMMLKYPEYVAQYLRVLPGLLTFTGSYGDQWIGAAPAVLWTLRAEFWFYVLFSLTLLIFGREHTLSIAIVGIAVSWIAKLLIGHSPEGVPSFLPIHTSVYLDQLMFGTICACLIERDAGSIRYYHNRFFLWFPLAAIFVLSTLKFKGFDWIWYAQTSAAAYFTAIMILDHAANPLRGDFEPLAALGRISYSVYLLHAVVEDYFPVSFPTAMQLYAELGVIFGVSILTYNKIELPFIRLSKAVARFT